MTPTAVVSDRGYSYVPAQFLLIDHAHPPREGSDFMGNQDEMVKIEMIEGLQRALDNNFQRLRENARREWEMRFAGNDPSDACVNVRVSTVPQARLSVLPCAGFLARSVRPLETGKMRPLLV